MISNVRIRWLVLVSLLLVAGWLAIFGDKTPSGGLVAEPSPAHAHDSVGASRTSALPPRAKADAAGAASAPQARLAALLDRRQAWPVSAGKPGVDIFSSTSWAPPAPVRPVASDQVQAPVAPPVPYEVLGKSQESGKWTVFLSKAGQTVIAREGDVLEGIYEVRKIAPPQLTLDYIPLHQAQVLDIGDFE